MTGLGLLPSLSVVLAAALLISNFPFVPVPWHLYLGALPLAMAGAGYALLQIFIKPPLPMLLKRLLLAATFLTWAVVQLLPPSHFATLLSDMVVAAYVLDLYWLAQEQIGKDQASATKPEPH